MKSNLFYNRPAVFLVGFSFLLASLSSFYNFKKNGSIFQIEEVTIGQQVWMKKNLDVVTFRNGDQIQEAKSNKEWETLNAKKQPAWCYYDNDPKNNQQFGKLYNWYAVADERGLAPAGWYLPSVDEWNVLLDFLGKRFEAGRKMITNEGFDAKSSGIRYGSEAFQHNQYKFSQKGEITYWWANTNSDLGKAGAAYVEFKTPLGRVGSFGKDMGFSVRCVKN